MAVLNSEPNIVAPDTFYEKLIEMHRDLTPEQSHAANARLILLLANHIGDSDVLDDDVWLENRLFPPPSDRPSDERPHPVGRLSIASCGARTSR